jgi:short-subunit dehydrogenase
MSLPKCFLEDKVAIVTGASAGIGRRVALRLALAGVNVVLAARRTIELEAARREIVELTGVRAIAVPTDVADLSELERLASAAVDEFGRIDILVNNAGVETFRHLHEISPHEITRAVQVNLTGAIVLSRWVVPHMQRQGWGHIVNMASTAGKYAPPFAAPYAATKAGLIALSQSLRAEYRPWGIRATAVCPGFARDGGIYERIREALGSDTPRVIGGTTADAVARAVLRAIRKDQPEVIVNWPPHRLFFAVSALAPRLGEYLFRKFAARYFRRIAESGAIEAPVVHRDAA